MGRRNGHHYTKKQWGIAIILTIAIIIVWVVLVNSSSEKVMSTAQTNGITSSTAISSDSGTSKSDGRITKDAYEKIKAGMTYDEVKKVVGSEGKNIFESGDKGTDSYQISYMWIGKNGGEATIAFSGKSELKVLMKSQSELK